MKYLFITLTVQDGENRHTHRVLHTTNSKNISFASQLYARNYYGKGERNDDWWEFNAGCIAVKVENVREISEYEYKLMWDIFTGFQKSESYFNIVAAGMNHDLEREEIQIHCGENGNMMIAKTPEGFVIDMYAQNDHVSTLPVWEDDLTPEEEDKPIFSETAIKEFKKKWGQSHKDLCEELGYNKKTSDDVIMLDFFWIAEDKKWYNKEASGFTDMEQLIANYLRHQQ
jgi:hypothetical protein